MNQNKPVKNDFSIKYYPWQPVFGYFAFGFLWILFSDIILEALVTDEEMYRNIQTYKGWIFILITTVMLFGLIYQENKRYHRIRREKDAMHQDLTIQKQYSDIFLRENNTSILVWDLEGNIIEANHAFLDLTGYGEEIIGKNWRHMPITVEQESKINALVKQIVRDKKILNYESVVQKSNGQKLYMLWNNILIEDPGDSRQVVIGFGINVTKEREQERKMLELVYHDTLTGLKNRMAFEHKLKEYIDEGVHITLMLIGIKGFKHLNEVHGHQYGDQFLAGYAKTIYKEMQHIRFYRWGGDEFIAVLKSDQEDKVEETVNRIKELTEVDWHFGDVVYSPEINIGVAGYPQDAHSLVSLLKNVDMAFQAAKNNPNHVEAYYHPELQRELEHRNLVEKALDSALSNNELTMYYQPLYDIETRQIHGFEMLLRWFNPRVNHIGEVISIAEQSGQIRKIDRWVLEKAFKVIYEGFNDKPYVFSVNISAQTFCSQHLINYFKGLLELYPINPSLIEIEVTEHSIVENVKEALAVASSIKALGFSISLDDFGTKYSSLNYLSKIDFDILKLDKSYIDDIVKSEKIKIVVSELIHLSSLLGIKTVAEGIETKEQEDILRALGCNLGQGYYFARPMAYEDILELI